MADYPERLRVRLARALGNGNPQGAYNILDEAFASMSTDTALAAVVLPCVQANGDHPESVWASATTDRIALLEFCLLGLAGRWDEGGNPTVVIASTGAERDTLGGIVFGLAVRDRGWRVVYLGSSTEPELAVRAVERADALALVLATPDTSRVVRFHDPLMRLGPSRHLLLAGDGATNAAARQLHADVLPPNPVLAAAQLHRRFCNTGTGQRLPCMGSL